MTTTKEEDLVIGTLPEGVEEQTEEVDWEVYDYVDRQLLGGACEGLTAVEGLNAMTSADSRRINRIKKRCIAMIDFYIGELYNMTFDKDEDDN
jgi:hypothetical protein